MVQKLRTMLVATLALTTSVASGLRAQNQQNDQGQSQQGQAGQSGQAGQPGQVTPPAPVVSAEEATALQAIQSEGQAGLNPDKLIQLCTDFATKYPSSRYLYFVHSLAAGAYQQKGDVAKAIEAANKGIKEKPDFVANYMIAAEMLPTPQGLGRSPADKDKNLQEAENDANKALELIAQLPKATPAETDDQVKKRRDTFNGEVYGALGLIHLQRAGEGLTGPDKEELAKAEDNYKKAIASSDVQFHAADYFRLGEAYTMDNKLDDAIDAFSKASQAAQGTPIQTMADQKVQMLKEAKRKAAAAPAPKQ